MRGERWHQLSPYFVSDLMITTWLQFSIYIFPLLTSLLTVECLGKRVHSSWMRPSTKHQRESSFMISIRCPWVGEKLPTTHLRLYCGGREVLDDWFSVMLWWPRSCRRLILGYVVVASIPLQTTEDRLKYEQHCKCFMRSDTSFCNPVLQLRTQYNYVPPA